MSNTEIKEKLSLFRRYIFEVVLIVLCYVVFNLHASSEKLQGDFRNYIIEDVQKLQKVIEENTNVLRTLKH